MPWDSTAPTDPKYRSREHRRRRAQLADLIRAGHTLECTARRCLFDTRAITNANGRAKDGLHLGHADNGVDYDGPQHNACNIRDGAVRASARSHSSRRWDL